MRHFVFCHGFGFDKNFWQKLLPFFKNEKISLVDLGYFGKKHIPMLGEGEEIIAIGHSLGFIKLMEFYPNLKYLIGLNAFVNFLGSASRLRETRLREFNWLKNKLSKNPAVALANFYKNCGITSFIAENLEAEVLRQDLVKLTNIYKANVNHILVLASMDDVIVPPSLIEENFSDSAIKVSMFETGQHMLGLANSQQVYQAIMDFINVDKTYTTTL